MSKIIFKVILLTTALCFMFAGCGKEKSPVQSDLVKESEMDDENYNYCTPAYGTYSYQELKYAIAEETMGDGTAKYAFFDDKYFDLSPMFYVKTYSDENGLKVYVD